MPRRRRKTLLLAASLLCALLLVFAIESRGSDEPPERIWYETGPGPASIPAFDAPGGSRVAGWTVQLDRGPGHRSPSGVWFPEDPRLSRSARITDPVRAWFGIRSQQRAWDLWTDPPGAHPSVAGWAEAMPCPGERLPDDQPDPSLAGTWSDDRMGVGSYLELYPDGALRIQKRPHSLRVHGTWVRHGRWVLLEYDGLQFEYLLEPDERSWVDRAGRRGRKTD